VSAFCKPRPAENKKWFHHDIEPIGWLRGTDAKVWARELIADVDCLFGRIVLHGWRDVGLGRRTIRRCNVSL
jgi:hypothetical protein